MSASTDIEEYFNDEEYRNREINFFINYIESDIPFFSNPKEKMMKSKGLPLMNEI